MRWLLTREGQEALFKNFFKGICRELAEDNPGQEKRTTEARSKSLRTAVTRIWRGGKR